ncbi:helix-turn-helix transcriptional regulator [Kineosporia mesophila]|uniref:Helix-turn-helix transcriptional regulator n=1 Tax=Kineosporia mesophila TaxID=566012 RepID=A0ABP6Z0T4_9ACTN|nr:helix-turn-helix transcriptional regulator [Kineosporia mesophila]MCD5351816.1 helix-turn-helix domain-containing protein [Kineosporia mesophila]
MSGTRPNPTASRRALAARLRRMRLAAGKSTEDAARELMASASKISRLESGERAPQPRDVRDLARYYGVNDDEIEQLQDLVLEARRKGWWADYALEDDEQAELYLGLEFAASEVELFENLRWPGLLQTEEVTRVVLENLKPPGELSREYVKDQVILRRERQQRLLEGEISLHAIMDEAVLRRPLGENVVRQQVRRIIELAKSLSSVVVQVVPFEAGFYPGLDGTFNILSYPEGSGLAAMVFVEGLRGNMLFERNEIVERYRGVFRDVASRDALDPEDTIRWLEHFDAP